jgi:hydroxyacylglutathione hydrolase
MSENIEVMYKTIDLESDIFCGHEYALANLSWGMSVETQNEAIKQLHSELKKQEAKHGIPCSIPSSLNKEKEINVFVRTVTGSPLLQEIVDSPPELMRILREMKNKNVSNYAEFKNSQL